ncbi:histidine phosphatase family protein [Chitinophaga solisilvae]|uniref:Histidine phosphatase family protein n=1 Tax=Chitinophaga solisilvae TaxID=1233460 RepID=A0A3S1CTS3_9BACT|nr:histidine phosphatase family protein [Chitinophaga solisilvae]NSL85219.1 histidine phosphatase family protein [Chitinophaga solisilvae]
MTRIAIIRHGSTSWNKAGRLQGHSDIPLDEEGLDQALKLGQRLSGESWDVIYSSHLIRARQTAAVIATELGLESTLQDHRLGEAGGGLIEGTTEAERIEKWGESWMQQELGREPNAAVIGRGMAFLEELLTSHPGKNIVLITHGSFIRQMLAHLLPEEMPAPPPMKNTSVTTLCFADSSWRCELFNCTTHLD